MAISTLKDAHHPIEELARFRPPISQSLRFVDRIRRFFFSRLRGSENISLFQQKAMTLREDVIFHQCIAESMLYIETGDKILQEMITSEDTPEFNSGIDALDLFKEALRLCTGKAIEIECIALSRLGKVNFCTQI